MRGEKYTMFIDETGDHNIDNEQPFSIIGVIFNDKYCINRNDKPSELKKKLCELKNEYFKNDNINLHLVDIMRGNKEYKKYSEEERYNFIKALPDFFKDINCKIISITIDKNKLKKYFRPSKDPYIIGFMHVLQNFYSFISNEKIESARIVIEGRDDYSNLLVQKAVFDVFNNGTIHLDIEEKLRSKIKGFIIAGKGDSSYQSGLEIADLLCNPLSRVRRGMIEVNNMCLRNFKYGTDNKIFEVIKKNIYCKNDIKDIRNWGFQKVPIVKKKRDWIND